MGSWGKEMRLTKQQESVLIGTLLGDGCLELNGSKVRLRVDHSDKQKDYVDWKYNVFSDIAANKPRLVKVLDKRTRKVYQHWRFDTLSKEIFVVYKKLFYNNNSKKIIPLNIEKLLTSELSLAVWFMDDGYNRKDCRALHLNTQSYSLEEQNILQSCLSNNFNLQVNIHKQSGKHKLYIASKEYNKFCNSIAKYIIPAMKYKLP